MKQKQRIALLGIMAGALILMACGSDSGSSSSNTDIPEVVTISNKTITGVSQKGPFVNGSSVTLQELEGASLAQTGKSFKGKISSDQGNFTISSVSLVSQYALLEANGYYRNEVTGEKSASTITLNALTDLSDRNSVNVNLLTHLEYGRALYLAQESGYNVSAAKKQAEKEIMNAFGIDSVYDVSENLSIFASGEGNAALLAISVMLQGNRDEATLSELLANFSSDIETDGVWDDAQLQANIADWASSQSLNSGLANIRSHILKWDLSDTVPDFEKYVKAYWYDNYGLGKCTVARQGVVLQDTNTLSSNNEAYYTCDSSTWRPASDLEKAPVLLGECTTDRENEISMAMSNYYICDSNAWRRASVLEYNTYDMTCLTDGSLQKGVVDSSIFYVCDDSQFREALSDEIEYGKGCVSYTYGDSLSILGYDFMECTTDSSWVRRIYFSTMAYEGQTYKTVGMGTQLWMAENLNYAVDSSWCYNNSADSCAKYGRLYQWTSAMNIDASYISTTWSGSDGNHQGICPEGWHLPNDEEWQTLYDYVDANNGSDGVGTSLKSASGWEASGTDHFGFSALPAGGRGNGEFNYAGNRAYFWSATEYSSDYAYSWYLYYDFEDFISSPNNTKDIGFSVRCLKDS